ncbi:hypothetical protein BDV93DRAFT_508709 [Ceratobasidium sp. AG-I]|nr:hypothetical protein BDV93DRAFT_508709 [Ceratobasidium sp. AG-I]
MSCEQFSQIPRSHAGIPHQNGQPALALACGNCENPRVTRIARNCGASRAFPRAGVPAQILLSKYSGESHACSSLTKADIDKRPSMKAFQSVEPNEPGKVHVLRSAPEQSHVLRRLKFSNEPPEHVLPGAPEAPSRT